VAWVGAGPGKASQSLVSSGRTWPNVAVGAAAADVRTCPRGRIHPAARHSGHEAGSAFFLRSCPPSLSLSLWGWVRPLPCRGSLLGSTMVGPELPASREVPSQWEDLCHEEPVTSVRRPRGPARRTCTALQEAVSTSIRMYKSRDTTAHAPSRSVRFGLIDIVGGRPRRPRGYGAHVRALLAPVRVPPCEKT
jgi:hypothetical protein